MKGSRLVTLLAFALLGCSLAAQDGERPNPNTSSAKSTFLVVYKPGPTWLPGKPLAGQPLKEHGSYVLSLFSKGELKIGGPFSDDAGGAAVLYAADEDAARSILMKDPAVIEGVFIYELHPWRLIDWESLVKK